MIFFVAPTPRARRGILALIPIGLALVGVVALRGRATPHVLSSTIPVVDEPTTRAPLLPRIPRAPQRPAANLAPIWEQPAVRASYVVGRHLVVEDNGYWQCLDPRTGARRGQPIVAAWQNVHVVGDRLLVETARDTLAAIEPCTWQRRWSTARRYAAPLAVTRELILLPTPIPAPTRAPFERIEGIAAVALDTGEERWRQPLACNFPAPSSRIVVATRNTIVVGCWGQWVGAFDAHDGRRLWQRQFVDDDGRFREYAALTLAIDEASERVFVGVPPLGVVSLDGRTGRELGRHDDTHVASGDQPWLAVRDGVLYVGAEQRVIAMDLAMQRTHWVSDADDPRAIFDELIVGRTFDGDVFALDRATGRRVWTWSVGNQSSLLLPEDEHAPALLFEGGNEGDDDGALVVFARQMVPAPFEHIVVTGHVRGGDRNVAITSATELHVRRDGRYEAKLRARGIVTVRALPASVPKYLRLDGRHHYRVDVEGFYEDCH